MTTNRPASGANLEHTNVVLRARLNDAVKSSGLSRTALAEELGMEPRSLSKRLDGPTPFKIAEVHALARILGLDMKALMLPPETGVQAGEGVPGDLAAQCRLMGWCDGSNVCSEYRDFDGSLSVTHAWTGGGESDALAVVSMWSVEGDGIGPVELAVVPSEDTAVTGDRARVMARELGRAADLYDRAQRTIVQLFPTATFRCLQSEVAHV